MKRIVLIGALLLTAANLAIGITYAATCQGPSEGRVCGSVCSRLPNRECYCEGTCTAEEMKWVASRPGAE
jgi:nicotinamide mononucleotide (NMN) deamidase PncC